MRDKIKKLHKDMGAVKAVTLMNSIMLCSLLLWSFIKPSHAGHSATATGGSVTSTVSVGEDPETASRKELLIRAKARGYFTASEYASFEGINLETVYRRIESGVINDASKMNGRWCIPVY